MTDFTCFECGSSGHIARECPNVTGLNGKPVWCGTCDEMTRHVDAGDGRVRRCRCHPLSGQQLASHRKCPQCRKTVVTWDTSPDCDKHILAGEQRPYTGKPAREIESDEEELRALAAAQAAASRAARRVSEPLQR